MVGCTYISHHLPCVGSYFEPPIHFWRHYYIGQGQGHSYPRSVPLKVAPVPLWCVLAALLPQTAGPSGPHTADPSEPQTTGPSGTRIADPSGPRTADPSETQTADPSGPLTDAGASGLTTAGSYSSEHFR